MDLALVLGIGYTVRKMYKINFHGIEVTCDDPQQVVELLRLAAGGAVGRKVSASGNGKVLRKHVNHSDLRTTVKVLRTIEAGGSSGADTPTIVSSLSLKGNRGVGGVLARVKRVLGEYGLERADVFTRRGVRGSRRWKPGPRLPEAIGKLEIANGGHV